MVGDWVSIWSGPSPAGTATWILANRSAHGMRCWSILMPLAAVNFWRSWSMIWPSAPVRPFQNESVMLPAPGFGAAAAAGLVGSAAAAGLVGSAGLAGAVVGAAVGAAACPQAARSAAEPSRATLRTNERRDVRICPFLLVVSRTGFVPGFVPAYTGARQGCCQASSPPGRSVVPASHHARRGARGRRAAVGRAAGERQPPGRGRGAPAARTGRDGAAWLRTEGARAAHAADRAGDRSAARAGADRHLLRRGDRRHPGRGAGVGLPDLAAHVRPGG